MELQLNSLPVNRKDSNTERVLIRCYSINVIINKMFVSLQSEEVKKEVTESTETLHVTRNESKELKHTLQSLEIELQSQLSMVSPKPPTSV